MSYDAKIARGLNKPIKEIAKSKILSVLKASNVPVKYGNLVFAVRIATGIKAQSTAERLTRTLLTELILELNPIVNDGADGYSLTNDVAKIRKMQQRQKHYRDKFNEKVIAFEQMISAFSVMPSAIELMEV